MRKVSDHIPSDFPMSARSSFKDIENKYDVFRDKDCMKSFCECKYIYKETFEDKYAKDKKHRKVIAKSSQTIVIIS